MSQWVCSVCTYLNHPALPQCEICESDRESKPPQSIDSDLQFAQRLQEQFDKEPTSTHPIQTNTNTKHNQPKTQSNDAQTSSRSDLPERSNSNSSSRQRTVPRRIKVTSRKLTVRQSRQSVKKKPSISNRSVSNRNSPNANSSNHNHNNSRKRKRSEIESELPHHNQCKIKEEEMRYHRSYQDIIHRIEHVRAGYETHSHHNKISTHLSPGATSTGRGNIASVIGLNDSKPSYQCQKGITIEHRRNGADLPYLIIDFNTTQVHIKSYCIKHPIWSEWSRTLNKSQYHGENNYMTNWVVEGSNDLKDDNWSIIHEVKDDRQLKTRNWAGSHFRIPPPHPPTYFTKIRLRMTAPNSSGSNKMKLQQLKLYGTMRRKVYPLPRVDEYKASDPFPAVGKNKCMGDIDNVFKILNESESLQHLECKEYVQEIPHLKVELKDYQKRGLEWLLLMENTGHDGIHGGLLCDEMGLGKTVQMIALMLVQKQRNANSQSKDRSLII
eukprot:406507_1